MRRDGVVMLRLYQTVVSCAGMELWLLVRVGGIESSLILKDVTMHTLMRILLKPLTDDLPCFGSYNISFVGQPFVNFKTGKEQRRSTLTHNHNNRALHSHSDLSDTVFMMGSSVCE